MAALPNNGMHPTRASADFDGDDKAGLAVYRQGDWNILNSAARLARYYQKPKRV
jgi:hypothetical protein